MRRIASRAAAPRPSSLRPVGGLAARVIAGLVPCLVLGPAASLAAQEPIGLRGMVVTADRRAAPEWTVAAHATVIDGAELERAGVAHVAEALRLLPGVAVVRGGSFGAVTSIFLRGGESDYVRVLVDGVAVNEPGGAFDFSSLTTDNVERIEVIRGPSSALYGSDAVSGVIQIFTRRGTGPPGGTLSFQGGSFGARRWRGGLAGGSDALSYSLSVGGTDSDGILAFNNRHRQTTASGRVQAIVDARTDATMAVRYADRTYHYPTDGAGAVVDRNAFTFGDEFSVSLEAGRRWTDAIETRISYGVHEAETGSEDLADGPADTLGFYGYANLNDIRRTTADARAIWRPEGGGAVAAGYEIERQAVRAFSQSMSQYGVSPSRSANERLNRALYGQVSWVLGGIALNGGARAEDNERFGTAATWRAGAAWRAGGSGTRVRLSAGTGIKEPTFLETYGTGFAKGNPDLRPERSLSLEAGIDQELGGILTLSVTGFGQSFEDLIQYSFTTPSPGAPNYHNVARARSRGIEAEARAEARGLRLTGSYTHLDTRVEDAGFQEGPGAAFVEGEPLLRRPRHGLAATAFAEVGGRAGMEVSARRTGERSDRNFASYPAEPVVLPAHTVVDLSGHFEVFGAGRGRGGDRDAATGARRGGASGNRPGLMVTVRLENVFDARYEEVWGFRAPGRGIYVGGRVLLGG